MFLKLRGNGDFVIEGMLCHRTWLLFMLLNAGDPTTAHLSPTVISLESYLKPSTFQVHSDRFIRLPSLLLTNYSLHEENLQILQPCVFRDIQIQINKLNKQQQIIISYNYYLLRKSSNLIKL